MAGGYLVPVHKKSVYIIIYKKHVFVNYLFFVLQKAIHSCITSGESTD